MSTPRRAAYGTWSSPITPDSLVAGTVSLSDLNVSAGGAFCWVERRPEDDGRQVLVSLRDGSIIDLIPAPFSVRTRVHEYGGRCWAHSQETAFFSNDADGRIWRVDAKGAKPITPESTNRSVRFGDLEILPGGTGLLAVRERHEKTGVINDLVWVDTTGASEPLVIASGHDFYAAPRVDPSGRRLAYVCWDLPSMPWESSELYSAKLDGATVTESRLVAGGPGISVSQPRFAPDGRLCFCSDHEGFWVPYDEHGQRLAPLGADYAQPDWVLGQSSFAFVSNGALLAARFDDGIQRIGHCKPNGFLPLPLPYTSVSGIATSGDEVAMLCASPWSLPEIVHIAANGSVDVLRSSGTVGKGIAPSLPRPIRFQGGDGEESFAIYYPPSNDDFEGEEGELPPLIVQVHGGPTSSTQPHFDLGRQFFTSRGIAVVDVNYGGSSGYGRVYRDRLRGKWGVLDVEDCAAAARHCIEKGLADPTRIVIRGASSGGLTALGALISTDAFAGAISRYGVTDLFSLVSDEHKFEAGYLDSLVGPLPEAEAVYRANSPLEHAASIDSPVLFLHGLDDRVVPIEQSEAMAGELRSRGVPVAFISFPGEAHGFRAASTIITAARAELAFLGAVLSFEPFLDGASRNEHLLGLEELSSWRTRGSDKPTD